MTINNLGNDFKFYFITMLKVYAETSCVVYLLGTIL
jgi:hypothetical protein